MPVRHEDDFQRRLIRSWDSWIEEAIREAQARGDFDNLDGTGKPIKLETNAFAPELQAGFTTLKNAGYEPTWMEIDREITRGRAELDTFLAKSVAYLETLRKDGASDAGASTCEVEVPGSWWSRFVRWLTFADDAKSQPITPAGPVDVMSIRSRMRTQYLERAASVDKKITEFHAALPRNLWHLERMRITPEYAGRTFDRACPSAQDAILMELPR